MYTHTTNVGVVESSLLPPLHGFPGSRTQVIRLTASCSKHKYFLPYTPVLSSPYTFSSFLQNCHCFFLFLKRGFSVLPWLYCMQTSLSSNWGDPPVSASQMLVLKLCITNTRLEKCYSLTMKQLQIPVLACRTVAPVTTG